MRRCGYTLVEVLIVLVILALLIALLFPVMSSARAAARKAKCISNLHQLSLAFGAYAQDYGRLPPFDTHQTGGHWMTQEQGHQTIAWWDLLLPYVGNNPVVFVCPESGYDVPGYIMNSSIDAEPLYKVNRGEKILAMDRRFPILPGEWIGAGTALPEFVDFRHQGGALFLYVDGRVKFHRPSDVQDRELWELSPARR